MRVDDLATRNKNNSIAQSHTFHFPPRTSTTTTEHRQQHPTMAAVAEYQYEEAQQGEQQGDEMEVSGRQLW